MIVAASSIACPRCGRISHSPADIEHRYCGACHQFHDDMEAEEGPDMTTVKKPYKPGDGQPITELYAWIATEPDGGEGVVAWTINGQMMPLIGADRTRIESLRRQAENTVEMSKCPVTLVRFHGREVLEQILPRATP